MAISPRMVTPRSRSASRVGWVQEIPGLITTCSIAPSQGSKLASSSARPSLTSIPLLVQGGGFALGRRVIGTLQHDHFSTLRFEQPRGTDSRASEPDDDGAAHGLTPVPTREMGDTGIEPVTPTVSR